MTSSAKELELSEETAIKRPRLQNESPDMGTENPVMVNMESSWVPSCGEASCASVDSGLDDVATPPPSTPPCASVDSGLDDVATPPPSAEGDAIPPAGEHNDNDDDDNMSEVSAISGISDMSGQEWKPNMKRGLAWLQRAMATGADPRAILIDLLPGGSQVPEGIDNVTLWKVLFNLLSEPPRREKLADVNTLEDVVQLIQGSSNILVLTGAGVSVSCGIPDFRSKDGVYARLAVDFPDLPDPQSMFDIKYFRKDPRPFFKFAREIYPGQFKPSPCHRFIQNIEAQDKLLRNYTQNIDTLEQVAGITQVIQCHGSFATASCTMCKRRVDSQDIREDIFKQTIPLCTECPKPDMEKILENLVKRKQEMAADFSEDDQDQKSSPLVKESASEISPNTPPSSPSQAPGSSHSSPPTPPGSSPVPGPSSSFCGPSASMEEASPFSSVPVMKPDIVFFGEGLPEEFHNSIARDKENVDLLIVIGSSLKVRPVALVPSSIPEHVPQILINREPLPHLTFDVELLGNCDTIINQLCLMLGEGWTSPVHAPKLNQHDGIPEAKQANAGENLGESAPVVDSKNDEVHADADASQTKNGMKSDPDSKSSEPNKTRVADEESEDLVKTDEKDDSIDDTKDNDDNSEKIRKDISEKIPAGQFLYLHPARYVFSGAELSIDSSDDEDDDEMDSDNNVSIEEESNVPEAEQKQTEESEF